MLYDVQGLSVIASHKIAKGQFVAQYAGEMLTNNEADRRLAEYDAEKAGVGHALLVSCSLVPCWLSRLAGMCNSRCLFPWAHHMFTMWNARRRDVTVLSSDMLWLTGCQGDTALWQSLLALQH